MFGRKPRLPVDAAFDILEDHRCKTGVAQEYLDDMKDRMVKTQTIIQDHIKKAQLKQKTIYDRKARAVKIDVGDKVLVKILAFDGKHKIQDRFEEELYDVVEQPREDIPVYKVRSRRSQKTKVLHRNHLVPVYHQDEEDESRTDVKPLVEEDTSTKEDDVQMKSDRSGNRRDEEESDSDDGNSCVYHVNKGGDAHLPRDLRTEEFSQRRTT